MRRAARVDRNHGEIIAALRKAGCSVLDLSGVGGGCPDVLVGRRNKMVLMEIKDGTKPPSARKLTPDENRFFIEWHGVALVIDSVPEALDAAEEWL